MLARKALAGTAGAPKVYVEDVFSTYLYTGNNSTQTITNNIDLSGKGGLVWIKDRVSAYNHKLIDTVRGIGTSSSGVLSSNLSNAAYDDVNSLTAFNSNGFSLGSNANYNSSSDTYASWTFRKAEKFFDVVTYTGNGSNRTISHSLGSTPGCIIVKRTDTTGDWQVYHRANTANPETDYLVLNSTAATADSDTRWNDTLPTSTEFSLGTEATVNANGGTYVAYLFAHDAGGFGDAGSDNVISCGSFTADGSGNATVTLGYEPQFVIIKASSTTAPWNMFDVMRGMAVGGSGSNNDNILVANTSAAETASYGCDPSATGFIANGWSASQTYIYIAIRRGPMKTPEAGTEVFTPLAFNQANNTSLTVGFPADLTMAFTRGGGDSSNTTFVDRLRGFPLTNSSTGNNVLVSSSTTAEYQDTAKTYAWTNTTATVGTAQANSSVIDYFFRRAPGFFDVVCYTGNGPGTQTISHNLGVVPELVINKSRSAINGWTVFQGSTTSLSGFLRLNTNNASGGDTLTVSSTSFTADSTIGLGMNTNGTTYVTYLFASLSGVSKIGTYTGNGSSVTVTTNFQPRFILVKRTDSTGDWIVSDSARGLVAGSDPYLLLNSTAAEDTDEDWVDITSTSFTVNQTTAANANVNTGTYIYLAVS